MVTSMIFQELLQLLDSAGEEVHLVFFWKGRDKPAVWWRVLDKDMDRKFSMDESYSNITNVDQCSWKKPFSFSNINSIDFY